MPFTSLPFLTPSVPFRVVIPCLSTPLPHFLSPVSVFTGPLHGEMSVRRCALPWSDVQCCPVAQCTMPYRTMLHCMHYSRTYARTHAHVSQNNTLDNKKNSSASNCKCACVRACVRIHTYVCNRPGPRFLRAGQFGTVRYNSVRLGSVRCPRFRLCTKRSWNPNDSKPSFLAGPDPALLIQSPV